MLDYLNRVKKGKKYYKDKLRLIHTVSKTSKETSNYTYDLTDQNIQYMVAFISVITGETREVIRAYIDELLSNKELIKTYQKAVKDNKDPKANAIPKFGRRLSWYVLIRSKKPKHVIETGIDKGLGALVICAALKKNKEEGYDGTYLGVDIKEGTGYLLGSPFKEMGTITYDNSHNFLKSYNTPIDFFIHDSNHTHEHEEAEYKIIKEKLTPNAILISDNAHASNSLATFSEQINKNFLSWKEEPKNHWYPGCITGYAF